MPTGVRLPHAYSQSQNPDTQFSLLGHPTWDRTIILGTVFEIFGLEPLSARKTTYSEAIHGETCL